MPEFDKKQWFLYPVYVLAFLCLCSFQFSVIFI